MSKNILIKPLITEKAELRSASLNQFTFVVDKRVNKIEIKKEIEQMYNVNVVSVNTLIMPSKAKNRFTRTGQVKGSKSGFKKAVITLEEGETIDFYGEQ